MADVQHTIACEIDRMILGVCAHDAKTGERISPPEIYPELA